MLEKIKHALEASTADGWKLLEKSVNGEEAYFIGKKIEMKRQKDILNYAITIYKDTKENGELKRGAMTVKIFPTHTEKEIKNIVERALEGASDIKNPWYPIFDPKDQIGPLTKEAESNNTTSQEIVELTKILFETSAPDDVFFNASEIFFSKNTYRLLNSNGLDASWNEEEGLIEFVVSTPSESEGNVEIIQQYHFSGSAQKKLSEQIKDQANRIIDRANAVPMPQDLSCPVVLYGANVRDFFFYYVAKSSAVMVYEKLSGFKPGELIQNDSGAADKVSLELTPHIPFSHLNQPVDEDGVPLLPKVLIEKGRLMQYRSDLRYGHYLSSEVTGNTKNYIVEKGSFKEKDLLESPHLEIHVFSDFNVDTQSGNFGGEIRLAYYYDGNVKIPVTGGAISGLIESVQNEMKLSDEIMTFENYQGPKFIYFPKVNITGCS